MAKYLLWIACAVLIATGLTVPVVVRGRGPSSERQPQQRAPAAAHAGVAASAVQGQTRDAVGFLGVVVALQSVELSAKFDGTLEGLSVQVGDRVMRGMPIARLDTRSVAQDLAIADAALRMAQAEHDRLAIEREDATNRRARLQSIPELVPREQISAAASQVDVATARLRGAVADLAGKRARVDQLKEMLRDAQIVAPFDGTIAARHVDAGTTVSRSTPIVRLISPASLVIRFAAPEERAGALAIGSRVVVRVESANLTTDGVIERVVPEIDAALRMAVFEARLVSRVSQDVIPTGAIARVSIPISDDRQATRRVQHLRVPRPLQQ